MPAVTFVVNGSLARSGGHFLALCREFTLRRGWVPEFLVTDKAEEGVSVAQQAALDGADLVVAVGGDGTVRSCAEALAGSGVPLGIVPHGTANLLAKSLGIPPHPRSALAVALRPDDDGLPPGQDGTGPGRAGLASGRAGPRRGPFARAYPGWSRPRGTVPEPRGSADRLIDLAVAEGVPFTAMAGLGLDAAVVAATHLKHQFGWLAYAVSGAAHLAVPPARFTIRLDDGPPMERDARSVVVGNLGLLPGGFRLMPQARVDDGLLDVGVLAPHGAFGWPRLATRVLTSSSREDSMLERFQARKVEITCQSLLPREVDGEIIPPGHSLTATVRPAALAVRVPVAAASPRQVELSR